MVQYMYNCELVPWASVIGAVVSEVFLCHILSRGMS